MPKISMQKGERLIAEIQANRVLYDSKHKDYSDLALKTKVWNVVAAKCGMRTGHEAKGMWKNLRDCYRISRSKQNLNPNIRPWRFFEKMEFIAPFIKYRKVVDESMLEQSLPLKVVDDKSPTEMPLEINETAREFTTVYYWNDTSKDKDLMNETANDDEQEMDVPEPEVKSRLQSPFDTDSFVDIPQEAESESSLKMFFDAMYASTSGLPLSLQRAVKKKIFSAVLEAEEEAEQLCEPPQAAPMEIKLEL